jgi:hypothetical protein
MGPATASSTGLRLVGHHDLGGNGDGMQLLRAGDVLYVGHTGTTKAGTSILDVADPTDPRLVAQWPAPPHTHTHKVQVADGLLLVNHERFPYRPTAPLGPHSAGVAVYTLDDPLHPEPLSFWESGGKGVHRIVWEGGRYAHMSATPAGFRDRIWLSLDLEDPAAPRLAGRWWVPGQADEEPAYQPPTGHAHGDHFRVAAHHALTAGGFAYLGYDDANLVVLDVTDFAHQAPTRGIHLLDISDPVSPRYLRQLPEPEAAYRELPSRFGAHNLHENRAGSYRSERFVFATYFSGGVRVYDLADADEPVEIAHWVPSPPPGQDVTQLNDLFVDDDLTIWVSERHTGGIYALRPDDDLAALLDGARS